MTYICGAFFWDFIKTRDKSWQQQNETCAAFLESFSALVGGDVDHECAKLLSNHEYQLSPFADINHSTVFYINMSNDNILYPYYSKSLIKDVIKRMPVKPKQKQFLLTRLAEFIQNQGETCVDNNHDIMMPNICDGKTCDKFQPMRRAQFYDTAKADAEGMRLERWCDLSKIDPVISIKGLCEAITAKEKSDEAETIKSLFFKGVHQIISSRNAEKDFHFMLKGEDGPSCFKLLLLLENPDFYLYASDIKKICDSNPLLKDKVIGVLGNDRVPPHAMTCRIELCLSIHDYYKPRELFKESDKKRDNRGSDHWGPE